MSDTEYSRFRGNNQPIFIQNPAITSLFHGFKPLIDLRRVQSNDINFQNIKFAIERAALIIEYFFHKMNGPRLNMDGHVENNIYSEYNDEKTHILIQLISETDESLTECITQIQSCYYEARDQENNFANLLNARYRDNTTLLAMFGKIKFGHYQTAYLIIKYILEKHSGKNINKFIKDTQSFIDTAKKAGALEYLKKALEEDSISYLKARGKYRKRARKSKRKSRKSKSKKSKKSKKSRKSRKY